MSKLDNLVVTNAGVRCRYRWAVSHPAPGILIDAILHLPELRDSFKLLIYDFVDLHPTLMF